MKKWRENLQYCLNTKIFRNICHYGTCCQITKSRENGGDSVPCVEINAIFFIATSFWKYLKCQVSINKMINHGTQSSTMVGENFKIYGVQITGKCICK